MVQQLVSRERWSRFVVVFGIAKAGRYEAKLKKHEGALEGRFRPARSTSIIAVVRRRYHDIRDMGNRHRSMIPWSSGSDDSTPTLQQQSR
ncbi:hypothetical protein GE21DRAFT_1210404 [Neurospora crassa]|nr:hypothetical protein GE21DRAFT_1210404 [Neurospora crassa]